MTVTGYNLTPASKMGRERVDALQKQYKQLKGTYPQGPKAGSVLWLEEKIREMEAAQGPPGPVGPIGKTGRRGAQGKNGKDGKTGPRGPAGKDGAVVVLLAPPGMKKKKTPAAE